MCKGSGYNYEKGRLDWLNNHLQCKFCERWLEADAKTIEYYATATHPVMCGQCVNEAARHMQENYQGHTFIVRTPEFVSITKY